MCNNILVRHLLFSLLSGSFLNLDINQEKIVEEGGLDALLGVLQSSQSATVLRVASGAIANLAMNGTLFHCSIF